MSRRGGTADPRFADSGRRPQTDRAGAGLLRAGFGVTVFFCLLLAGWAIAVPAAAQAPAERRLAAADAQRQGLLALQRAAGRATQQAAALDRAGREVERLFGTALQQHAQERALGLQVDDCLTRLRDQVDASGAAVDAAARSIERSRGAVRAVSGAAAATLAQAAGSADAAFDQRAVAERDLSDSMGRLASAIRNCLSTSNDVRRTLTDASATQRLLQAAAVALPATGRQLQQALDSTLADGRAAARQGWLADAVAPVAPAPIDRLDALAQAVDRLAPPTGRTPADVDPARPLRDTADTYLRLSAELSRLGDAAAHVDLLAPTTAAAGCAAGPCPSPDDEHRQRAAAIDAARAALASERLRQTEAPRTLEAPLLPLLQALQDGERRLRELEPAVTPGVAQSARSAAQARAATDALTAAVEPALARAQREWEAAYRLARGSEPPQQAVAAAPPPAPAPARPAMAAPSLDLQGHAYEFFASWDTERRGFGAYTYVLLKSGSDLRRPEVLRRYTQVLALLRREREAAQVAADEAARTNLFCIPGNRPVDGGEIDPRGSDYADDLAKQLLYRAQSGLLNRPEVQRRRIGPAAASAGPFLITLPGRIADARSITPLLFADLGNYPEDAIADLVNQYMAGLLTDFPMEKAQWRPRVGLRVALAMIRLAGDASGLVTSILPAAQAAPPTR